MEIPKIFKGLTKEGRAEEKLTEKEKEGTETREWLLKEITERAKLFDISPEVVEEMLSSYKCTPRGTNSGIDASVSIDGAIISLTFGAIEGDVRPVLVNGKEPSLEDQRGFNQKYGEIIELFDKLVRKGDWQAYDVRQERELENAIARDRERSKRK